VERAGNRNHADPGDRTHGIPSESPPVKESPLHLRRKSSGMKLDGRQRAVRMLREKTLTDPRSTSWKNWTVLSAFGGWRRT
jgi:hypothetical protein